MDFDELPFSGNVLVLVVAVAILLYFLPIIHALSLPVRPAHPTCVVAAN